MMANGSDVPVRVKGAGIKIAGAEDARASVETEASQVRRVKLSGFPPTATLSNVQSVVWGGNIQELQYQPGAPIAIALFVKAEDCQKYYAATANGIPYPSDPSKYITVEQLEPEPAHGMVKDYVEKDITRCIRVYDIDAEWGKAALTRHAQGSGSTKRALERVVNGQNGKGRRIADFRFAKISDAVVFKGELDRDIEWEACTIKYGPDPCALHDNVHTGML
ncbi:hypothetical protein EJ08DRAFT_29953 [Tothia fuscella]|uniref:Uncharacterized protein n=1 Tax=Tothia fuscella TaxID=1048955 RepID=A0A9P4TSI7_9PEZI|nr:hypothetical protein EJ08DRAFT_29953 [Tothia fuscella]